MSRCLQKRIGRSLLNWLVGLVLATGSLTVVQPAIGQMYLEVPYDPSKPFPEELPSNPHRHAILIGAEDYAKFPKLRYTVNDCTQLAHTLIERGGFPRYQVVQIVDAPIDRDRGPVRSTMMSVIEQKLQALTPEDELVVFFSGHGYRDQEGKLYLATLDCDPLHPADTGVPVQWLRDQLASCPAKFKLLLLDACHAGSEKGEEAPPSTPSKDLGEPFRDVAGVFTLASSTAEETSQLWEEKQQSLFSYWLNQGLKGNADENGDSNVDVDELNKYVHANVTRVAKARFHRSQTPVRIVRAMAGVPVVLELSPLSLKELLADMAEQLSWSIADRGIKKVAVLEFTTETKLGEMLGANFGLLGKQCASDLENRLTNVAAGNFSVIDQRRLQSALKAQKFRIDDLGSDNSMKNLSTTVGGLPAIAQGTLRSRRGRAITLQCKLLETDTGAVAASAGGVAMLTESEWAMLGHSAEITNEDIPPPSPDNPVDNRPKADLVVYELDKKSKGKNPLADPNFLFPVRLKIGGKERRGTFKGNDYIVPVRKGEVYEIEVENRSGAPVMMRLLVDGLNTLPERASGEKGVGTYVTAKRVSLEDARASVLDPKRGTRFGIRGFVTATGARGKYREFLIVDGADSLGARQEFTEQLGLITVAFYEAIGLSRGNQPGSALGAAPGSFGTGLGNEGTGDFAENEEFQLGRLRAVVNIRYASADAIQNADNPPAADETPAPSPQT